MVGQSVAHFQIVEKIGEGGMGVVYRANDLRLGRSVALKFLPDAVSRDPAALERFRREARAASALNHANLCTVHELGEFEGRPFIVMELLEGHTLRQRLAGKVLKFDDLLPIALQIVAGLEAAHAKGIVHRDIKPANIFLTADGATKIMDFGLAKLAVKPAPGPAATTEVMITAPGTGVGTLSYMSPEQARGEELDARTDLFSCGVVLYEMATGTRPFRGDTEVAVAEAILARTPTPPLQLNPELPPDLERIIGKALEKDRRLRYQSAADLRTDLQRLGRDQSGAAAAPVQPLRPRRRNFWIRAIAAAVVLLAPAAFFLSQREPSLTERDSIVLADFANTTGDPVFDDTLKRALAFQLEQSPFLNIFSEERVRQTLRSMGRSIDERITTPVAREICERHGVKAVLTGAIGALGSHYVVALEAINAHTGEALVREQAEAESKETVLRTLGKAASRLRRRLGESLKSIEKLDVPVEENTSSLEALQAASLGWKQFSKGAYADAIPLFRRALELDPNFAFACADIGMAYYNLGERQLGAEYLQKAFDVRDHASEREALIIASTYHLTVTGDLEQAMEAGKLLRNLYPRDAAAANNLGLVYIRLGQFEKARAELDESIRLRTGDAVQYANLAWANALLNRYDEALAVCRKAAAEKLDYSATHVIQYRMAFLRGDGAAVQREIEWAKGKPGEYAMLAADADAAAFAGALARARATYKRAFELAIQGKFNEAASLVALRHAMTEVAFGYPGPAREAADQAVALMRSRATLPLAALVLALSGAAPRAEALLGEMRSRFPSDTLIRLVAIPAVRAALAMGRRDPAQAGEVLAAAAPYDLAEFAGIGWPVIMHLRAQASLGAGKAPEAAAEFRKILDHRGFAPVSPLYALAHLGLARALTAAGDARGSRQSCEDFLVLWKNSDPDTAVLKEARDECGRQHL